MTSYLNLTQNTTEQIGFVCCYLFLGLRRVVNVEEGGHDVDDQAEDGDQVGGHPHGNEGQHFVPPKTKMKVLSISLKAI